MGKKIKKFLKALGDAQVRAFEVNFMKHCHQVLNVL